jgi:hypothetical protein
VKSSLRGCVLSLLKQTGSDTQGRVHDSLQSLYKENKQGLSRESASTLRLINTLNQILGDIGSGYIVMDAMDECSETAHIITWLETLKTKFNIVITSRSSPDMRIDHTCFKLSMGHNNEHDIEQYIEMEVEKYSFMGDLKDLVMTTLKEKAEGQ